MLSLIRSEINAWNAMEKVPCFELKTGTAERRTENVVLKFYVLCCTTSEINSQSPFENTEP